MNLDAGTTAILALDLQNDIVNGAFDSDHVIDVCSSVLGAGRTAKVLCVHITVSFREDYADAPAATHPLYQLVREHRSVIEGTEGAAIHNGVRPRADELVLNKKCVDPFVTTALSQVLRCRSIDTLILMGTWTEFVVEATARTAADMGFRVIVVSDGCSSSSKDSHEDALAFLPNVATLLASEQIIKALR